MLHHNNLPYLKGFFSTETGIEPSTQQMPIKRARALTPSFKFTSSKPTRTQACQLMSKWPKCQ